MRGAIQALAIRAWHGQGDNRRLLDRILAVLEQRYVIRLHRVLIAIHLVVERCIHEMLNRRHAAKRGLQRDRGRAAPGEAIGNPAIRTDVGAAEAVDRLLWIADDEQGSGTDGAVIGAGELEQQVGLQRIGVLELVDEDHPKTLPEFLADVLVVMHKVPRLDQQIEKVQRAGLLFALLVAAQALAHLLVQQCGKVGVGLVAKRAQILEELGVRGERLIARHTNREGCPGSLLPDIGEVAVLRQPHEARLPAIPDSLGHHVADHAALALDVAAGDARRSERHREVVVTLDRLGDQVGERLQLGVQDLDRVLAIVDWPLPRRGVVAPFAQAARRGAQPLDRAVLVVIVEPPLDGPSQRAPDALRRIGKLLVQPRGKRLLEKPLSLRVRQHRERGIDARLHRALAQQLGAESMDGADLRFFEVVHGILEQIGSI